jgi:hypothetical protein
MVVHEGSHPSGQGRPLSRRFIPDELFQAIKELVGLGADLHDSPPFCVRSNGRFHDKSPFPNRISRTESSSMTGSPSP